MDLQTIFNGFSESIPIKTTKSIKIIKETIVYLLVCDRLNVFIVAPPSVGAKSSMARFFTEVMPDRFFLISGTASITKAGVRDKIIEVGKRKGLVFFDEIHRAPSDVKKLLYDLLQFHRVQVIKKLGFRTVTDDALVYCNVLATANPLGDYWASYGDVDKMKEQMPLDSSILRRFHIVIAADDYDISEYKEICADVGNEYDVKDLENKIETFINASKEIDVIVEKIPDFVIDYLTRLKERSYYTLFPVTPELKVAIVELAKGTARLSTLLNPKKYEKYVKEGIKVTEDHFRFAINFFSKTFNYLPCLLYTSPSPRDGLLSRMPSSA